MDCVCPGAARSVDHAAARFHSRATMAGDVLDKIAPAKTTCEKINLATKVDWAEENRLGDP